MCCPSCLLISSLLQRCLPPLPLHCSLLAFHHSLHPSLLSGWINMQTALLSSAVEASCLGVLSAPMELSLVCGWIFLSCPKHFSNAFPFSLLGGKCDGCMTRFSCWWKKLNNDFFRRNDKEWNQCEWLSQTAPKWGFRRIWDLFCFRLKFHFSTTDLGEQVWVVFSL